MPSPLLELSPDEVLSMPIDRLGMLVLQHLVEDNEWNSHNFINFGHNERVPTNALRCWAEALNWLISRNLVSRDSPEQSNAQAIFVTRLGHRALEEGLDTIRAAERIDVTISHYYVGSAYSPGHF